MSFLHDALQALPPDATPMHMPGHKRQAGKYPYLQGAGVDVTEMTGFDNLQAPQGMIWQAMRDLSALYGAERSFLLVNGATVGLLAGVFTLLKRGERALVARNCHQAVFHALRLRGAVITVIDPETDGVRIGALSPDKVRAALAKESFQALIFTCPTYDGILSDVGALVDAARQRGARVLADEAHGAHFSLHPAFPKSAVRWGADVVVQSYHKTLASLTQTAVAHVGEWAAESYQFWLNHFQTSSPSYLLLSSLTGCIARLRQEGEGALQAWETALAWFYHEAGRLKHLRVRMDAGTDRSKVVVCTDQTDLSSEALFALMRDEFHIEAEMCMEAAVLFLTGMGDDARTLRRLLAALEQVDARLRFAPPRQEEALPLPPLVLSVVEQDGAGGQWRPLDRAVGQTAMDDVTVYPPGIPVLLEGARVEQAHVAYIERALARGKQAPGVKNGCIRVQGTI